MIRYVFKALGNLQYAPYSVLSCHYSQHAELIMLCDHLMWHWPLTWFVACRPPSPRVYLSGRYHRRLPVSSAGPHCYVIAAGSTVTHVKVVENEDLIHSTTSLVTPSHSNPPSTPLSAWDQSITQSLSLCRGAVGTCHIKERAMDLETRQQFDNVILISWNWKMALGGRWGRGDCTAVSKCQVH